MNKAALSCWVKDRRCVNALLFFKEHPDVEKGEEEVTG